MLITSKITKLFSSNLVSLCKIGWAIRIYNQKKIFFILPENFRKIPDFSGKMVWCRIFQQSFIHETCFKNLLCQFVYWLLVYTQIDSKNIEKGYFPASEVRHLKRKIEKIKFFFLKLVSPKDNMIFRWILLRILKIRRALIPVIKKNHVFKNQAKIQAKT